MGWINSRNSICKLPSPCSVPFVLPPFYCAVSIIRRCPAPASIIVEGIMQDKEGGGVGEVRFQQHSCVDYLLLPAKDSFPGLLAVTRTGELYGHAMVIVPCTCKVDSVDLALVLIV